MPFEKFEPQIHPETDIDAVSRHPYFVRMTEAARITGLPRSLLQKCFMREEKRPRNIPPPPPHKRIGRAIYILADQLAAWIESLGEPGDGKFQKRHPGRPTVPERITRRRHQA